MAAVAGTAGLARQPAANPYAPDTAEPGSVEAIAKHTTDPKFVNPWVAYVPASARVPSPTKYLGRIAGTPGELTRTPQIYGYRDLNHSDYRFLWNTIINWRYLVEGRR